MAFARRAATAYVAVRRKNHHMPMSKPAVATADTAATTQAGGPGRGGGISGRAMTAELLSWDPGPVGMRKSKSVDFPPWAAGLSCGISASDGGGTADSPQGARA